MLSSAVLSEGLAASRASRRQSAAYCLKSSRVLKGVPPGLGPSRNRVPRRGLPPNASPEKFKEVYLKVLNDIRVYLREMNVSEQLADAMLRIEPDRIRWLNAAEAQRYGLTEYDPVDKELSDLEQAKRWKVDRVEYMRRSRLVESICRRLPRSDDWSECFNAIMRTGEWSGSVSRSQSTAPSTTPAPCYSCYGDVVPQEPVPPPRPRNPLGGLY